MSCFIKNKNKKKKGFMQTDITPKIKDTCIHLTFYIPSYSYVGMRKRFKQCLI